MNDDDKNETKRKEDLRPSCKLKKKWFFLKIFRKFVTLKNRRFWNSKEFSENFQKIGQEFQRIVSFL
jgi:hypothetical protein